MAFMLSALIAATMPALMQATGQDRSAATRLSPVEVRAPLARKDSIRALKAARRAQNDFEVLHRQLLPRQSGLYERNCDVVIGRFCHWQNSNGNGPPPEDPEVVQGRERLLKVLDSLGRRIPGDRWIIAQKLRYRLEAGRMEEADSVAAACAASTTVSATRSWCRALTGYTAQERGDYTNAEAAFASALAEMPEQERCQFQDLSLILEGKAKGRYKRLSCAERDSMATALWRLVQPLYLTGVNDLKTEFFARVTRMNMERNSRSPMSYSQGADDRETLLRYGGGLWYTQDDPPPGSTRPSIVASHRRGPAFNFFPDAGALASPEQLRLDDWNFTGVASRTRYAPEYAQVFHPLLDHQLAVFRRGDSALIVAAFDVTADGALGGGQLRAGVFAAVFENGGVSVPLGGPIENPRPTTISTLQAPWRSLIVSLEVLDAATRAAGRARYSVKLPEAGPRLSLSDVLLYAPRDSTPTRLKDALPLALHTARVPRGQPLGLFWETYGVHKTGEEMAIAVLVEPIGQSWFRRAFTKLRIVDKQKGLSVQWQEAPDAADGIASRAVAVDLSTLKPGRYRVRLSLTPKGDLPIVSNREIEVM